MYYDVLRGTTMMYYYVLLCTISYYCVLRGTTIYYDVLRCTTMYYDILLCTTMIYYYDVLHSIEYIPPHRSTHTHTHFITHWCYIYCVFRCLIACLEADHTSNWLHTLSVCVCVCLEESPIVCIRFSFLLWCIQCFCIHFFSLFFDCLGNSQKKRTPDSE